MTLHYETISYHKQGTVLETAGIEPQFNAEWWGCHVGGAGMLPS